MLTTNGLLLPKMAFDLKAAGVQRVNISLDTMDPKCFHEITRGGDVSTVIQGVFRSLEAGLNPVKINVVVVRGFNTDELPSFLTLAKKYPLHVCFIELMPIGISSEQRKRFCSHSKNERTVRPERVRSHTGYPGRWTRRVCSTKGL